MIQHVYERAVRSRILDWCIVATDDERIAAVVRDFGGHAVMTPETLQTGTDRVAYVARSLSDASIIVNVQGDEPLLEPEMIDQAVRPLVTDQSLLAGTLVRAIDREEDLAQPGTVKVVLDLEGNCLYFSRSPVPHMRDGLTGTWSRHHQYYKHIGLYVYRRDFLIRLADLHQTPLELTEKLEQLRILEHGYRIRGTVTSFDSIPVDTTEDLERVRSFFAGKA